MNFPSVSSMVQNNSDHRGRYCCIQRYNILKISSNSPNVILQLGSTEGLILGQQLVFKTLRGTSWSWDSGVERRELVSKVFMNTRMLQKDWFLGCDLKNKIKEN